MIRDTLVGLTRFSTGRCCGCHAVLFAVPLAATLVSTPASASRSLAAEPAVEAIDFESRLVYRSEREPHYAAWTSFFPGEDGKWYIGCEEVSLPDPPLPQASPAAVYGMALPVGYDK